MSSSLSVGNSNVRNTINRKLIVETAVVSQDATVAVRSIFTKTNVADDEKLRKTLTQQSDGRNYGSFGIVGRSSKGILYTWSDRDTEEYN